MANKALVADAPEGLLALEADGSRVCEGALDKVVSVGGVAGHLLDLHEFLVVECGYFFYVDFADLLNGKTVAFGVCTE